MCLNNKLQFDDFHFVGIMEKLGLGPDRLLSDNPKLVYARINGFGQNGPLTEKAGHDINYISMSGKFVTFLLRNWVDLFGSGYWIIFDATFTRGKKYQYFCGGQFY